MPVDLTIFAATNLMKVDAGLAVVVVVALLFRRRHANVVWWTITTGLMGIFTFVFSRLGSAVYTDPRPFATQHFRPLLPHTANNGFPAGYAVAAAAIVFAVVLLSRRWAIPFVIMAILIDCARVGVGFHHTVDIVGAWLFVLLAAVTAFIFGWLPAAILLPRIPAKLTAERLRLGRVPEAQPSP